MNHLNLLMKKEDNNQMRLATKDEIHKNSIQQGVKMLNNSVKETSTALASNGQKMLIFPYENPNNVVSKVNQPTKDDVLKKLDYIQSRIRLMHSCSMLPDEDIEFLSEWCDDLEHYLHN